MTGEYTFHRSERPLKANTSGIIASVITMKHYKARFTDDASIRGAVVSTFNGVYIYSSQLQPRQHIFRWMLFRSSGGWMVFLIYLHKKFD